MFYQIEDALHPIDQAVCESNHLTVGTVSYTHLDVYKRQVVRCILTVR